MATKKTIARTIEVLDKINLGETTLVQVTERRKPLKKGRSFFVEMNWYTLLENPVRESLVTPLSYLRTEILNGNESTFTDNEILTLKQFVESGTLDGFSIPKLGVISTTSED